MPKRAYAKQCTFIRGIVSTQKKIKEKNVYLARQKQLGGMY